MDVVGVAGRPHCKCAQPRTAVRVFVIVGIAIIDVVFIVVFFVLFITFVAADQYGARSSAASD